MKLSELITKGGTRRTWLLMAGIGTAAAMTLAPIAVGISGATQLKLTAFPTMTTTVGTNATWSATGNPALVECPYSTYRTIKGATWIWTHYTGTNTGCRTTGNGPPTAPASTVNLSTTFTVPGNVQGATLTFASDNGGTVSINGTSVATLSVGNYPSDFTTGLTTVTVTSAVRSGMNTITIVATNIKYSGYNPGGAIALLKVTSTLNSIDLCKHTGWKQWKTPTFANQGDCVSYLVGNGNDPTIP